MKNIHQIRIDIDVLIKMADELPRSRETSLGFTKLQEARMHVGNTIDALGAFTPYQNSMDASNDKIDPYFQPEGLTPMAVPGDWNQSSLIANVKIIRREVDAMISRAKGILIAQATELENTVAAISFKGEAVIRLAEAKNWYGMELGRIRSESM